MKKMIFIVLILVMGFTTFSYGGMRKLTEIPLGGMFMVDKIQVFEIQDSDMPFISIYLTSIKSGNPMAMADPSDNSISTRLTGKIGKINKKTNMKVINLKKSIGWKTLKIARFYDNINNTLVYVTYSTKVFNGSYKHSISVVPLGLKNK